MADYKGGEIFIDLGGIDIEKTSTTNTNRVTVSGIYSRLETAIKLGKRVVITNYKSQYGNHPIQNGVPLSVSLYRPTATTFYIPVLGYIGNSMIDISSTDSVSVAKVYTYHNIYTPPATTTNNAKTLEETAIEKEEKGEESK